MERLELITGSILAEAEAEAAQVKAEAEKKAAEITESYRVRAQEIYDARMASGTADLEQNALLVERNAKLDAKKKLLEAKQNMLNASYAKAAELLRGMDRDAYIDFLLGKLGASSGSGVLVLNAADRAAIGEELINKAKASGKDLVLSDEAGDFAGGFILRDGRIEVNCTLEALVDMSRSTMDAELVGVLFN